jgi:hypothetical protein
MYQIEQAERTHIIIHNTGRKKKTETQAYVSPLNWKPTLSPARENILG